MVLRQQDIKKTNILGLVRNTEKKKQGFVALVSVIVLSVIAIIVVTSVFSFNTNNLVNIKTTQNALKAKTNADSCVEIGLNKLKTLLTYAGNETVVMDCGSCVISTISGSGNSGRAFTSTGTCNNVTRRMSVTVTTVNPTTVIGDWKEIP